MTLRDLSIGQSAVITEVGGEGALRHHFLDMGVIPGAEIKLVKYAPMGDPMQLLVQGYELTLRVADAGKIEVKPCEETSEQPAVNIPAATNPEGEEHPGFGETVHYHNHTDEHPLPKDSHFTFALVGNQNCGKTTLFNQLTGSNQHVGNFPGVTVEQKSGPVKGNPNTTVTDLPGIYSLSPYSNEELVSRRFILEAHPSCIIDIVDATNIERNLYLTLQLMELDVPMVLALNMMDEVTGNGGSVRINEMEHILGLPVIPISATRNEGVDELVEHALHVARYKERPGRKDFCDPNDHGGAVHRCLHATMHLIEDHARRAGIPVRFAAGKLIEGDKLVEKALRLDQNEKETIGHILRQLEDERGLDPAAAMADMRFSYIRRLAAATVVRPRESREHRRSRKIDSILTGRYTAVPAFLLIMVFIFWLTFDLLGGTLQDYLEQGIESLTQTIDNAFNTWQVNETIHSLVTGGILPGVGTVISFLPIIVILFFFLSILEDTGYMARIAFVMDKPLRRLGLSGRSIVPLLMGFGCSVPSVMASRTLPSERDRKLTVMLTPFMSCTAKLPIYGFFTAAFFPHYAAWVMIGLYLTGILVGIAVALVMKKTLYRGEAVPFVMELPNYRLPGAKTVWRLLWQKSKDFIQRAFSIIFLATIVIWFLQTFDFHLRQVSDSSQSILAAIASVVAPIFSPAGFADWRIVTSLISGFLAKESVVATLSVLFKSSAALYQVLTPVTALSLLVFCLLYTPCVATIATVRREMGGRYAFCLVVWQCTIAWVCAVAVRWIALLFV